MAQRIVLVDTSGDELFSGVSELRTLAPPRAAAAEAPLPADCPAPAADLPSLAEAHEEDDEIPPTLRSPGQPPRPESGYHAVVRDAAGDHDRHDDERAA